MINSFVDENRFLSNFYPASVEFDGLVYKSVEHAYVASKTLNKSLRLEIQCIFSAGQAKRFGRELNLRPDWDEVKLGIMTDLVNRKFRHPELLEKLLETNGHELIEGNFWHDNYWGDCFCADCSFIKGKNNLGKILMQIRDFPKIDLESIDKN